MKNRYVEETTLLTKIKKLDDWTSRSEVVVALSLRIGVCLSCRSISD